MNEPIRTGRLDLEPLRPEHAEECFGPLQDPRLYTWISSKPPATPEALRARYERLQSRRSPRDDEDWLNWAIRVRDTGEVAGTIDGTLAADGTLTIGYVVYTAHRGRGVATEAAGGVVSALLATGRVRRVRATVTQGHEASIRVLEKLGFVRTRVIPHADCIDGVWHDDVELVLPIGP